MNSSKSSAYIFLGADEPSLRALALQLFPEISPAGTSPAALPFPLFSATDALYLDLFPGNPVDALEALPATLRENSLELARIIALVDASVLEKRPELKPWFALLTHFADVLLLSNVPAATPAAVSALKKSLHDRPLLVYQWPPKHLTDALRLEILTPEARRLSQYFEELPTLNTPIFTDDEDEEAREADDVDRKTADDLDEEQLPEELYFKRDAAGRRTIKILAP